VLCGATRKKGMRRRGREKTRAKEFLLLCSMIGIYRRKPKQFLLFIFSL